MRFSTETLELNLIKEKVFNHLFTNTAIEEFDKLIPSTNLLEVKRLLDETDNTLKIIAKYGSFPFLADFDDIFLNKKKIERVYNLDELINFYSYLKMEKEFIYYKEKSDKAVSDVFVFINNHFHIQKEFDKTFNDYGEIFDDASIELKKIRTKIKGLTLDLDTKLQKLIEKNQTILADNKIVIRNNRKCISVSESNKNKIKGVVHDISKSGQTVFIEPEISLDITAKIELEKILEEKEIFKIFASLTNLINKNYDSLMSNFKNFIDLDILHAKAKYALSINAIKPEINKEGYINLVNAKHPLLDLKRAVPISLSLSKVKNTLIITGPNTGGKTVALKTVGILTLMCQIGLLIPVSENTSVAIFDNIFADIGDKQSIIDSLSTFSSHMTLIKEFFDNITDNSLILLDELGSGTEPSEGISLALAIIEEFRNYDTRLIVTSHYKELKTYALEKDDIITASVAFDIESLMPLYYLKHGTTGESHARLVAKRLGIRKSIIDKANEFFGNKETDLAKVLKKLNEEEILLDKERKRVMELEKNYINSKKALEETREKLINEQEKTLEEIKKTEQAKWLLKEKEVNALLEIMEEEKEIKEHQIANLKGLVNKKDKNTFIEETRKLAVGDTVYIKPYQQIGKILKINNSKYLVNFGVFSLEFNKNELKLETSIKEKKTDEIKRRKTSSNENTISRTPSLNIDLRGFRYEEVREKLEQGIDQALLNNLHSIYIIHGFGTGVVRKAVYDYIEKSNLIKSYRYGGEGEGLNGVTIIELK